MVVPLDEQRLAVHRGTRQSDPSLIFDDHNGWRGAALARCTGEHTLQEIAASLDGTGHPVAAAELAGFFESLATSNVLADATAYSNGELTQAQQERYSRNLNGFAATASGDETPGSLQQRLFDGHVLMLGAGGLGSLTSLALAMAGCGKISVIDFDTVELSNLNRQAYTVADVGSQKVEALRARIAAANPEVIVNTVARRLNGPGDVKNALADFAPDIVVAAIDRPTIAADRWISDACFTAGIPAVFNSVSAGKGLLWSKVPGSTGCFQCDELWAAQNSPEHYQVRRYREEHDLIPATSASSYSAMTVGGFMASDIIRHLLGRPMASAGKLIVIDFATLAVSIQEKPAHADCKICQPTR
ncbi:MULTISPECIES: ThiF family adenylyltransferase [Paraburkholderia]|uniref:HesA/MoeB/ThiF family protein n=1 Tax=Paraburkholderia TaxID=1822464 RepID=UPI002257DD9D|nr:MULTISPECIES: ThiF family adenylyltransferase [Paraburkholderia]MCX4165033.1 ThiF family adenylyltransferase [Paraburkholderia megapolitana]MDN7160526.1 ThiF family adenylyltransferase [Paraburkholderia sp. CHISQ3]MDQ6497573.1 ThiF family adenylyltransferase [Paraburkholderia megapolitana]